MWIHSFVMNLFLPIAAYKYPKLTVMQVFID